MALASVNMYNSGHTKYQRGNKKCKKQYTIYRANYMENAFYIQLR